MRIWIDTVGTYDLKGTMHVLWFTNGFPTQPFKVKECVYPKNKMDQKKHNDIFKKVL